ncbi:MAG: hypothetical protein RJA22_3349, partial [Verrucomicrobiota bacterium]
MNLLRTPAPALTPFPLAHMNAPFPRRLPGLGLLAALLLALLAPPPSA